MKHVAIIKEVLFIPESFNTIIPIVFHYKIIVVLEFLTTNSKDYFVLNSGS